MVLVFGMTVIGCATSHHQVEISNVNNNISEVYIRNAGTSNWGKNLLNDLNNIDKSKYSERVDIRVVDTNGIVYSKQNVPFGDAAFVQTSKTSSPNMIATGALSLIVVIILLSIL